MSRSLWAGLFAVVTATALIGERHVAADPRSVAVPRPAPMLERSRPVDAARATVTAVTGIEVVVHDLARSRAFFELLGFSVERLALYRARLGLHVVGESENYGPEQEHLNGVFGARLRITALRAASGPGIELLEYLAPRGGRPMPLDVQANDLFHWQVMATTESSDAVALAAAETGGRRVSPARARDEALVRDRDGHALFVRNFAPR